MQTCVLVKKADLAEVPQKKVTASPYETRLYVDSQGGTGYHFHFIKDKYLFRRMYHSKGRMGVKTRPKTTLTLRLEEQAPELVGTGKNIVKHGKFNGLIKHHWKRWKGKIDAQPGGRNKKEAAETGGEGA